MERYRQAERLLSSRNPHAALTVVQPLVESEPDTVAVLVLAARANFDCARLDQAESLFRRVVELDPTHHYAHAGLGRTLQRRTATAKPSCTCAWRRPWMPNPGTRRPWPAPRRACGSRAARDALHCSPMTSQRPRTWASS